jgi:hypothetical protein
LFTSNHLRQVGGEVVACSASGSGGMLLVTFTSALTIGALPVVVQLAQSRPSAPASD